MNLFNKKAGDHLYAGLKNQTNISNDTVPKKEKKLEINRKFIVTVTSLKHGAGSSYISAAIANYISDNFSKKICILHNGCPYIDSALYDDIDSRYYPCDMSEVYARYSFIIYDGGIWEEVDSDMMDRSDIKVMMCWPNNEYKNLLIDFINRRKDINNWIFMFNQVPDKKQTEIYDTMEDYNTYCLPTFDVFNIDKSLNKIFKELFTK